MSKLSPGEIAGVVERARCVLSAEEVEVALDTMAAAIAERLADSDPILLCVMNGGLIACGRLATRLNFPLQLDYLHATRYREKTTGADLQWRVRPSISLQGRSVLIIDDIFDEGATLASIVDYCKEEGAEQVLSAVLFDKQHTRKMTDLQPDFIGLEVPDFYLYGYGMDYKGYLRNAAGVFAVAEQDV